MGLFSRVKSKLKPAPLHNISAESSKVAEDVQSPTLPALSLPSPRLDESRKSAATDTPVSWVDVARPEEGAVEGTRRLHRYDRARLSADAILPFLEVCSQEIKARGLETLGIFRPWRLAESPAAISGIINTFLRSTRNGEDKATMAEVVEQVSFASVHDVVAAFKWTLRHLAYSEGFAASSAGQERWAWLDKLKNGSLSKDTWLKVVANMLPKSHLAMVEVVMSTVAGVAALSETNGMSSPAIARLLGFWLFGCGARAYDSVDAFVKDWTQASEGFELLFHCYLKSQDKLPKRLKEIIARPHRPAPATGELRVVLTGEEKRIGVKELLDRTLGAEVKVDGGDERMIGAWTTLLADQSYGILDDDFSRIINAAAAKEANGVVDGASPQPDGPTRRRSLTLDAPRVTSKPSQERMRSGSHGVANQPASGNRVVTPSWAEFSQGGFSTSQVNLGLDDTFVEHSPSEGSANVSPVISGKSPASGGVASQTSSPQVPAVEPKITSIVVSSVDGGIADLFLDALDEPVIRARWPLFVIVRLRKAVNVQDISIKLLLIEHAVVKPEPKEQEASPALSEYASSATSEKKRRDFLSFGSFGRRTSRGASTAKKSRRQSAVVEPKPARPAEVESEPAKEPAPVSNIVPALSMSSFGSGLGIAGLAGDSAPSSPEKARQPAPPTIKEEVVEQGETAVDEDALVISLPAPNHAQQGLSSDASRLSMVPEERSAPPTPTLPVDPVLRRAESDKSTQEQPAPKPEEQAPKPDTDAASTLGDDASFAVSSRAIFNRTPAASFASQPETPVTADFNDKTQTLPAVPAAPSIASEAEDEALRPTSPTGSRFSEDLPSPRRLHSTSISHRSVVEAGIKPSNASVEGDKEVLEPVIARDPYLDAAATKQAALPPPSPSAESPEQFNEQATKEPESPVDSFSPPLRIKPTLVQQKSAPSTPVKEATAAVTPVKPSSRPSTPLSASRSSIGSQPSSPVTSPTKKQNRLSLGAKRLASSFRGKRSASSASMPMEQSPVKTPSAVAEEPKFDEPSPMIETPVVAVTSADFAIAQVVEAQAARSPIEKEATPEVETKQEEMIEETEAEKEAEQSDIADPTPTSAAATEVEAVIEPKPIAPVELKALDDAIKSLAVGSEVGSAHQAAAHSIAAEEGLKLREQSSMEAAEDDIKPATQEPVQPAATKTIDEERETIAASLEPLTRSRSNSHRSTNTVDDGIASAAGSERPGREATPQGPPTFLTSSIAGHVVPQQSTTLAPVSPPRASPAAVAEAEKAATPTSPVSPISAVATPEHQSPARLEAPDTPVAQTKRLSTVNLAALNGEKEEKATAAGEPEETSTQRSSFETADTANRSPHNGSVTTFESFDE